MIKIAVAKINAGTTANLKVDGGLVPVKARACKVISPDGVKLSEYASPYLWRFEERVVDDLAGLFGLIKECAVSDSAIVIGTLSGDWHKDPSKTYRRLSAENGGIIAKVPNRLLTIDLDGPIIPGFDPLDPVPSIDAYVMPRLGAEFKECGYIAQLTTGQRPAPESPARVRLWFLMDRPMSFEGRMRFVRQLKLFSPELCIDHSSVNVCQVNYTSPPFVVPELNEQTMYDPAAHALPDILPARLFLSDGPMLDVEEPVVEVYSVDSSGGGEGFVLHDVGSELKAIESEGLEVHDKILAATFSLARNRRGMPAEDVVELIYGRLVELSEPGQPLHSRADRIRAKLTKIEIREAYESAVRKASLRSLGLRFDSAEGVTLAAAEEMLTRALNAAIADKEQRVHLIKSTCGLGKTRSMLETIKRTNGVTHFFAPDHKKASEVTADARAMGIRTAHIKGRTKEDADGTPLCAKVESLNLHQGSTMHRHIDTSMTCKGVHFVDVPVIGDPWVASKREAVHVKCPHYDVCGYNRQFHQDAELYVFTHANLAHSMNENLPRPVLTVIDEDPCGALRKEEKFTLEDMRDWGDYNTSACVEFLCNGIEKGNDLLNAFLQFTQNLAERLGQDEVETANALIRRMRSKAWSYFRRTAGDISPEMDGVTTLAKVTKRPVAAPWISLLDVIEKAYRAGATSTPEVRFERKKGCDLVTVRRMLSPKCDLGEKTVLLDATPHDVGLKHIFGGFKMHEFEVEENIFEVQALTPTFANQTLRDMVKEGSGTLEDLMAFTRMVSLEGNAGLVTCKEFAPDFPTKAGRYEVPFMTFGALRGQNCMESKSVLVSVGRLLVPAEAAEGDAAAIYTDIDLSDGSQDYYRAPAKYTVRVGKGVFRDVVKDGIYLRHPDPRVEYEKEQRLLNEYKQAKGRLRGVRASERKLIINCSNIPTGDPVDMLVEKLSDLIGPARMARIMECHMGSLPLRPKYLLEKFPEHFETYESAKQFVADVREWFESADRRFFLRIHEHPDDVTAATSWRAGSRGRSKEPGEVIRIRFWREVRRDPDLGDETPSRVKEFMLPYEGCDQRFVDTY